MFCSSHSGYLAARTSLWQRLYVTYGKRQTPTKEPWSSDVRDDSNTIGIFWERDGKCARCGKEAIKGSGNCLQDREVHISHKSTATFSAETRHYDLDAYANDLIAATQKMLDDYSNRCLAEYKGSNEIKN
jgi:hypothetical protein